MAAPVLNRRTAARAVLAAALVGAILAAYVYRAALDPAALDAWVRGAGAWGPLLFIATYAVAAVVWFPGSLLTLAGASATAIPTRLPTRSSASVGPSLTITVNPLKAI